LALTMLAQGHTGVLVPDVLYHVATGGSMSAWLPSFAYRLLPWLSRVKRYREAERRIREKHGLPSDLTPTLSLQERERKVDLSIIIVSWNVRDLLARCVASIEKGRGALTMEIFVVDNASSDGTQEYLKKISPPLAPPRGVGEPRMTSILNATNRGFAAACNQAIAQAKGQYILLLNPDTECIESGAFERMIAFMAEHPRCGILGPKLVGTDGAWQPSVRRFPTARALILGSLGKRQSTAVRQYLTDDLEPEREQTVDQVMGACFLIRRELLDTVGALDERFFIWFEEVDLCFRAREAGFAVWYTPSVVFRHHGGTSFAQVATFKKQWMFGKSATQYFWKRRMVGSALLTAVMIPIRLFITAIR
jgi:GT2 family glycosyltransferase